MNAKKATAEDERPGIKLEAECQGLPASRLAALFPFIVL